MPRYWQVFARRVSHSYIAENMENSLFQWVVALESLTLPASRGLPVAAADPPLATSLSLSLYSSIIPMHYISRYVGSDEIIEPPPPSLYIHTPTHYKLSFPWLGEAWSFQHYSIRLPDYSGFSDGSGIRGGFVKKRKILS